MTDNDRSGCTCCREPVLVPPKAHKQPNVVTVGNLHVLNHQCGQPQGVVALCSSHL